MASSTAIAPNTARSRREVRVGKVVSDVRNKTIKVQYDFNVRHEKYGKTLRRRSMLHAHDENNEAKMGDTVEITACRRLSKTKCWRLTEVLRRAAV